LRCALLLLLFQVVPIAIGANASFRNWALYNRRNVGGSTIPCRDQRSGVPLRGAANTFLFMVLSVTGAVVGLALALLLNRPFHGKSWCNGPVGALMVAPVSPHHGALDVQRPVRHRQCGTEAIASTGSRAGAAMERIRIILLTTSGCGRRGSRCCCSPACRVCEEPFEAAAIDAPDLRYSGS